MLKRSWGCALSVALLACALGFGVYYLPPVYERLAWRVKNLQARVQYALDPPQEVVFLPQEQVETLVQPTLQAIQASLTLPPPPSATPSPTPPPGPTDTPTHTSTVTPTPTALPETVVLSGVKHEYQKFNNCGPANLSMALTFWGWQGDQLDTRAYLRPNYEVDDKNVDPAEMVVFVNSQTPFQALARIGGDLDTLKRLIAGGFPVLVEKGHDPPDDDWMGHYVLLNGYDDARARFISQDSLILPDLPVPYQVLEQVEWRDFNYAFLVVYPPERQAEVLALLGPFADPAYGYRAAAERALQESAALSGREQYFAWYNRGASLVYLEDYAGAAQAFDAAFGLYAALPQDVRPWRALWYRSEPYAAYYHTARYQDVVNLANTALSTLNEPVLEEAYYWRGLAKEALGDLEGAIQDLQKAAALNPNYAPAAEQLQRLGVITP